ncbi:MAG: hypothetical protein ACK4ZN_10230, partial [Oceanibaculum sp.]
MSGLSTLKPRGAPQKRSSFAAIALLGLLMVPVLAIEGRQTEDIMESPSTAAAGSCSGGRTPTATAGSRPSGT